MPRKWDVLSKENQQQCINDVITRIEDTDPSSVGIIAAQDIIDIVSEHIGPEIYRKAVEDVIKKLKIHFADIETELDLLEHS